MSPCQQSARIDATLFNPESALYQEYLHGSGYTNTFAQITGLYGMGEIDVSKPMAPAWEASRCYQEILDLRKEAEPRVKLATTATGRSDPTFYMSCVGENPVLLALLYCILKTNHAASAIFSSLFCRDLGDIGLDTLEIDDPPAAFALATAPAASSSAASSAATSSAASLALAQAASGASAVVAHTMRASNKRPASALSLLTPTHLTPLVKSPIEVEEEEAARESLRAAKAISTGAKLKAGQEAATLMKMLLELPEAERAPLRQLINQSVAALIKDTNTSAASEPATPPAVFTTAAPGTAPAPAP